MSLIEAPTAHDEAEAVALILREAAETAARLLHAEWHLLSPCGHCPHVEQPEAFAQAVGGLLYLA